MATPKVGGEVDAFCTKCRMTLAHTILAMVGSKIARVQCNTCNGQHAYRHEPGARTPVAPRAPQPRKEVISLTTRLLERDPATARPYSPKETFAEDDLISHPTFGLGIVSGVRLDKIDVAFKAFEKTLVHGRGDGPQAKPTFAPPPPREAGPADKPAPPEAGSPRPASPAAESAD
jgi:hypothetical protein